MCIGLMLIDIAIQELVLPWVTDNINDFQISGLFNLKNGKPATPDTTPSENPLA